MADVWYKDSKTGKLYQDRIEGGKTVRYTRDDTSESSTIRAEARSSSRRDQQTHRSRRQSVVSSGSIDTKSRKSQTQRGTSSKRENSIRPNDGRRRAERSDATYISESPSYGREIEQPAAYGDMQTHMYGEGERRYHPPGGYNSQQGYVVPSGGDVADADDLVGGMKNLSMDDHYTHLPPATSQSATTDYVQRYETREPDPTVVDYGQPHAASSTTQSKQIVPLSRQVKGTPGDSERLDNSYQVRNHDYKKFFRIGRVFSTLWTEGVGNNVENVDQTFVSEIVYQEKVHSKVRRFVIVREGDRSVTCLPVTSYDGAGHKKRGIRLGDHGFIHSKNAPKRVDGMLSKSLKVILSRGAAHIKDPSLVNYGKVYTVETNVKVKDIGDLDRDSKDVLVRYWRRVFIGDADLPIEAELTPRQSNAYLVGVGGAANDLTSTSQYNTAASTSGYPPPIPYSPSTSQDIRTEYSPNTYAVPGSTGYTTTHDSQSLRYDSMYQQPAQSTWYAASSDPRVDRGPVYQSHPSGSRYPTDNSYSSTIGYETTPGAAYNVSAVNPGYSSSMSTYAPSDTTAPYSTVTPYSYTPRTTNSYASETPPTSGYVQPSGSAGFGGSYSSGEPYPAYQNTPNPRVPYREEDDINLPTLEESRKRRDSNAGTSRSDHHRVRRR